MADSNAGPLPSIAALPPTTVRQLGSSNVLRDPSSVVKELIDNALDARTYAIFVDITANTLDSIQVKDTGHGISAEDRTLVCRRYCTSKIRDFHDLNEIGGKWLGFRGEALASMAEMSGTLEVTTRVEGEPVAAKLKYGRDGELASAEHASAPVGTTVKVTNFFEALPVRKSISLKESSKTLAKLKRLIQAYAFTRPSVRFTLRVLKAKSNKGDFMYAPKTNGNVEDAVLKIIGKDCALQCNWTAMESDGFEIHAFLPKPDATGTKIANMGAFLSIDNRPVSYSRGTAKKITAVFKERLRKGNPEFASVKDPFLYLNIICPPGSYDPNIEPAKDDVLFEREDVVLNAVTKLFVAYYPEAVVVNNVDEDSEPSASAQTRVQTPASETITRPDTAFSVLGEVASVHSKRPETAFSTLEELAPAEYSQPVVNSNNPPQWRSTMYGIDEDHLDVIASEDQPPVVEEEEDGRGAASNSNPWSIARMRASIKPKPPTKNTQLMTPAKGHDELSMGSSSPIPAASTPRRIALEPLTPQTSSRSNTNPLSRNSILRHSIIRPSQVSKQSWQPIGQENVETGMFSVTRNARTTVPLQMGSSSPAAPRRSRRNQKLPGGQQSLHAFEGRPRDNDWFGKPMRGHAPSMVSRPRKTKRSQGLSCPIFELEDVALPLASKNDSDIREFFGRNRAAVQQSASFEPTPGPPSFTPINRPSKQLRILNAERSIQQGPSRPTDNGSMSRASSVEPSHRSQRDEIQSAHNLDSPQPLELIDRFRVYAERDFPARPGSIDSNNKITTAHTTTQRAEPPERSRCPTARPKTSDHEMAAMFAAYSDAPNTSTANIHPTRTRHPQPNRDTPKRRRTTDGPQRRRSARIPLERVPHGCRTHDIVLQINVRTAQLTQAMLRLDMRRNSVEWGYPAAASGFDAFATKVTDGMLKAWVLRIDSMLEGSDTGMDRDGALRTLESGIREALRRRGHDGEQDIEDTWVGEVEETGVEECIDRSDQVGFEPPAFVPTMVVTSPASRTFAASKTVDPACLVRRDGCDAFGGEDVDDGEILMEC